MTTAVGLEGKGASLVAGGDGRIGGDVRIGGTSGGGDGGIGGGGAQSAEYPPRRKSCPVHVPRPEYETLKIASNTPRPY